MKRIGVYFFALFLFIQTGSWCQCNTTLSKSGNAHLKAAQTLARMASSTEDQEQVIVEYEKVLQSDPSYAPACMALGRLYTEMGNQQGKDAFDMAEYYFNKCKQACMDSADAVDVELAVLDALRRKYANGPNRFAGIWGYWGDYTGEFYPCVEIKVSGKNLSFRIIGDEKIVEKKESPTEIVFTYEVVFDKQPELRKKGLSHYYNDRDNNADPGYPTTGRYNYDKEIVRYTESFSIEGNSVIRKCLKMHTDYYFNGQKTYADTDRDWKFMRELVKY